MTATRTITQVADAWGLPRQQFWMRGRSPQDPVRFDAELGLWNVYGYPEAVRVLTDPRTFSSDTQRLIPDLVDRNEFSVGNLVQLDPPQHHKLRTLVSHAFTPKVVADLGPRIGRLTNELLDRVTPGTHLELVADLAYPLPVIVIAELLGVPSSDRHLFKQWVDGMFQRDQQISVVERTQEQQRQIAEAMKQVRNLRHYLADHVAERRARPRQDLLTRLVQAEVDGVRLSDDEVVNFTMLLGNTVLCLDASPEAAARVRADRSLVPGAIEESLRLLTPFAALGRSTTREVELGGQHLSADQLLLVWIAAANRDERQFDRPHVFDPTRDPNPHLGFGRGIHFCLGAPLARLEGRVALNLLFDRFAEFRVDPENPPAFMPSPNLTGVGTLPLLVRSAAGE
jgi:cytochrome P450